MQALFAQNFLATQGVPATATGELRPKAALAGDVGFMGALRTVPNILEMPVGERRGFDVQRALRRTHLGNNAAKSVLLALAGYVNADGWCYVSTQTLLYEADIEQRTLQTVKRILGEMGILEHVRLTKAEMAMLRMQGEDGAFREEEWQLNVAKLGADLSNEYCDRLAAVSGKKPKLVGVRGKANPGPSRAAAADAVATQESAAAAELCAAAAYPSDSLLGKNTIEHEGTPMRAEAAPQGVSSAMLHVAAKATAASCGWRGVLAEREVVPACVEAMSDLCRELGCDASEVNALMVAAWQLDQRSVSPTLSVAHWFAGGRWKLCVERVLADRELAKRAEVGVERRVESDDAPVVFEADAVDAWRGVLVELERVVNRQSFATWLRPTKGQRMEGDVLVVKVPGEQFLHLGARYERELAGALSVVDCGVSAVRFEV